MAVTTQLSAKLVTCIVPTTNSAAAQQFYNTLFGGNDFARSLNNSLVSYFRPIDQSGLTLALAPRNDTREPIVCLFAVDDLSTMVSHLVAAGGKLVVNSTALPVSGSATALKAAQTVTSSTSLGHFATMQDPDGNYFGLIQVDSSMQAVFQSAPAQRTLSSTQVSNLTSSIQTGTAI